VLRYFHSILDQEPWYFILPLLLQKFVSPSEIFNFCNVNVIDCRFLLTCSIEWYC
jgi:hypothetical protein